MKCLRAWREEEAENSAAFLSDQDDSTLDILVLGGIGGRFDQGFSQLHQLYKASEDRSLLKGQIFLINTESICFLLAKGANRIKTPLGPGLFAENIGIIPIGRPSIISTLGLEWDVQEWHTEFGMQVSTSNHVRNDIIQVNTTEKVLFTIELDLDVYKS